MDFEDLLDEVEGVMQGTTLSGSTNGSYSSSSSRKPSYGSSTTPSTTAKTTSDRPSYSRTSSTSRNDIDDLLDMIGDDESEPAAVVQPRSASSAISTLSSTPSNKDEFQGGSKKKCSQLLLDGEHSKRAVNTALSSHSVCSNLRCNDCDFTVVQFLGKKWSASADYMFFRENVPNEAKLRVKMDTAPGVVAYACQCKWLSIDVQTRVDSCRVKWACAGH